VTSAGHRESSSSWKEFTVRAVNWAVGVIVLSASVV